MSESNSNNLEIEEVEKSNLNLSLPKEILNELEITEKEEAILTLKERTILINLKNNSKNNQEVTLQWFLIPSIIISVIFLCYFLFQGQTKVALIGDISIASFTIVLGLFSGIICFLYFFIKGKRNEIDATSKDIYWRNFPAVLISFIIILAFVLLLFFNVMDLLFRGVAFDIITSTFFFLMLISIINYVMIYLAIALTPSLLTNILIITIVGGVGVAMITNRELQWWQNNFSFLGPLKQTVHGVLILP